MKRLTTKEIQQINELIKRDNSLNKISKIMNKSKTTIYYHFRRIKGTTMKPLKLNYENDELWGEFLGLVAGDGCLNKTKQYNYRVYLFFNKTEKEYVKELEKLLYKLFGKGPSIFDRGDIFILWYSSKKLYNLIKDYLLWDDVGRKSHSVHLKNKGYSKQFKMGFLRGLIDSDGYLSHKKITFATSSSSLAKDTKRFLEDLEINYYYAIYKDKRENRMDMHHINIRMKERERFLNLINPREKKNICAGRDSNFRIKPC